MNRLVRVFLAAFLTLLVTTLSLFAQARLDIDDTGFDFGLIPQVCKVSHGYTMRSTGKDTLKILNVKPGCGCTKSPTFKDVVVPGDSTSVELIFSSIASYRGTVQKSATVTCNDDARGTFLIRFKATINAFPDSAKPAQLSPWDVKIGLAKRALETSIDVKNVSSEPLMLTAVDIPVDFLIVNFPKEPIAAGKSGKIGIKVAPGCKADSFEKSFTFATNTASDAPRYTVPVVLGTPPATEAGH